MTLRPEVIELSSQHGAELGSSDMTYAKRAQLGVLATTVQKGTVSQSEGSTDLIEVSALESLKSTLGC
jgi:hypothetical protein